MLGFPRAKIALIITAALLVIQLGADLDGPLWEQDEAAYAGFARNMIETGDWIVPQFPFSEPHRKPPLHFWMIAVSFLIFGESEIALRLPSILSFLGATALLAGLGAKLYGRQRALLASLVFITALFFSNFAKISLTDSLLLFCQTGAILSLGLYLKDGRTAYLLLLAGATAMGLLTKGPPILILIGGPIFLALFQAEGRRRLLHPAFIACMLLAFVPLLMWGWLAYRQTNGELIRWMIDWYVLRRAGGAVFGQSAPPGLYLLFLLVAFLPWSPALFAYARDQWRAMRPLRPMLSLPVLRRIFDRYSFEFGWALSGWLFYEMLPSKLPSYVLGAAPLFAVVIAGQLLKYGSSIPLYYRIAAPLGALINALIWIIVPSLVQERRAASQEMAYVIDAAAKSKTVYISESFRLPGVAFYSKSPMKTITSPLELEQIKQCGDCILVLDAGTYLIMYMQGITAEQHDVYLWDRGKTVPFFIFHPNERP